MRPLAGVRCQTRPLDRQPPPQGALGALEVAGAVERVAEPDQRDPDDQVVGAEARFERGQRPLVEAPRLLVLADLPAGTPNRLLYVAPDARAANACFSWSCDATTDQCAFNAGCSWMPSALGYYLWDFGDGHSAYASSAVVTHAFPGNDIFSVELTVLPWYANPDTEGACVNTTSVGLFGCLLCSTVP